MGRSGYRARSGRVTAVAAAVLVMAGLLLAVPTAENARADTLPAGFTSTPVFTGLTLPTAMAFSPDGKVYVAQKNGIVRVYPSASSNAGTIFKDLSSKTYNNYDRGMLGLTVDPRLGNATGHDFIYVLYAKDAPPGQTPPVWNDSCSSPPGPHTDGCVVSGTLSRIPVNADGTAGAEQVIIDNQWCQQFTSHSVGDLAFGPDGYLYAGGGEGASYQNIDWGQFGGTLGGTPTPVNPCGDPPGGFGVANTSPSGRGGALRAQSPRRPSGEPRLLNGALLRINPDTGAGAPGNPSYDASSPASNGSRILAYGLRNPYRFTMRPGTNEIWVGDVGAGGYEEIDRITSTTPSQSPNFGWPCFEGVPQRAGYKDLDLCKSLYTDTSNPAQSPYFAYQHHVGMNAADSCDVAGGAAISGVEFYTGTRYPAQYSNALFFGDYTRNCLYVMYAGANGLPDPSTARPFIDDADNPFPVDIDVDPVSKDIFYVNIGLGTVNRISYTSSNRAPTAVAGASPTSGTAPLTVQFVGGTSSDPDGDALAYSWDVDGNGSFGDATGPNPSVTYNTGGTFQARLLVTDPGGLSDTSDAVPITVSTAAGPTNAGAPAVTGTTTVGSTLSSTTGVWNGSAPIFFSRQWQRCTAPSSCSDISGATGTTYALQLGDAGFTMRVRVTALNAGGSGVATSNTVGPITGGGSNAAPVPVIDTPTTSFNWSAGQTVSFSGHATDAEDGTEPTRSRLDWDIVLGHCTEDGCHNHPVSTITGQASGNFSAPDHEAPSYLDFTLTATDSVGATASVTRRINPRTVNLSFQTTPGGLSLTVGSGETTTTTPFTQQWVVNSQVQVIAPPTQASGGVDYGFSNWSTGGAATHTFSAPTNATTYIATYGPLGAGYIGDGFGGVHAVGSVPAPSAGPYWPGWNISRGVARHPGGGGYVVDGLGGLHRFRGGGVQPPAITGGPYWPGWDIARGVAVLPNGAGGYVLDGFGGLHEVAVGGSTPPRANVTAYWPGWDIARGLTINADGKGGYVVDAFGGLHPFAIGNNPLPPAASGGPYWPGWDIVRGISANANGPGGYILDGYGGVHRYSAGGLPPKFAPGPYWPGWNIARGLST